MAQAQYGVTAPLMPGGTVVPILLGSFFVPGITGSDEHVFRKTPNPNLAALWADTLAAQRAREAQWTPLERIHNRNITKNPDMIGRTDLPWLK